MKGRIDKDGHLEIYRQNRYIHQYCPFATIGTGHRNNPECGDWCPLFSEPDIDGKYMQIIEGNTITINSSFLGIRICQNRELRFTEFEDLRSKE